MFKVEDNGERLIQQWIWGRVEGRTDWFDDEMDEGRQ